MLTFNIPIKHSQTQQVVRFKRNPPTPIGISRWKAAIDTLRANPSSRRSKSPTVPMISESPMKWIDSQMGHAHGIVRIQNEICVLESHS